MSLQLILGSAGSGKSHYIYEKIIEESMAHSEKNYMILVPDQFTMQTQIEVVSRHPWGGILNIDVLSFTRLAYHIFQETGCQTPPVLEEMGKSFVLQRVAQEKKGELKVLGNRMGKSGYVQEVKSLVSELMQYGISPGELGTIEKRLENKPLLSRKLADIQILYRGFQEFLENHYVTAEEILEILCRVLPEAESMKRMTVVLDSFTGFTPIQNRLIGVLLACCEKVYVVVTIDDEEDPYRPCPVHNRSWMSKKTIRALLRKAKEGGISIDEPVRMDNACGGRYIHAPALGFLKQHLFRFDRAVYEGEQEEIQILEAGNPRREMEETARRIKELVREKQFRYRDIAVITGDLGNYGWETQRAFEKAGIPCFIDMRRSVLMNPMIECIRAVLDMQITGYSYESVFRFLRSGLSGLTEDEIDELENYCLALGIRGRKNWESRFFKSSRNMDPARLPALEDMRSRFMAEIIPFAEKIREKNRSVKTCCEALYELLVRLDVQKKLDEQGKRFESEGNMAMAREYAQVYRTVMDLMDKLVEILGEEKITLKDFRQTMEAGLQELRIGIIPPTADQVLVGDVERTRLGHVKALFFVGINEDKIPGRGTQGGILSEADRDTLSEMEIELAPTAREEMYIQKFYLYLHLTKPSEYLILSYARSNGKGEHVGPAYLIRTILRMFPALEVTPVGELPEEGQIESREDGFRLLLESIRHMGEIPVTEQQKELFCWFLQQPGGRRLMESLMEAATYHREQDRISAAAARALYGDVLSNSVTRIEKYAACAYAHFLQYGLQLKERDEFIFRPLDMGNVLHRAMELFSAEVRKQGKNFTALSEEDTESLLAHALARTMEEYGNQILSSTNRNRYNLERARKLLRRSIWALKEELKDSDFLPEGFEVNFDHQAFLDSMMLRLSEDGRMFLKGKIDRLDTCEDGDHLYVRVIDYKSGNTSFDFEAFYYGLQLQLVLYLKAAMELEQRRYPEKQIEPAAILYYHMKDPLIEAGGGDPETLRLKELKLNGLVSSREEILKHLDTTLKPGDKSRMLPVEIKKDGTLSARSKAVGEGQFAVLNTYAGEKAIRIGREILEGHVEINPYKRRGKTACDYCSYRSVCGFDERLPGCTYRQLAEMNDDDIWTELFKLAAGSGEKDGRDEG